MSKNKIGDHLICSDSTWYNSQQLPGGVLARSNW